MKQFGELDGAVLAESHQEEGVTAGAGNER
jgi:hypothetical protein